MSICSYPWEACYFLNRNGGGVDIREAVGKWGERLGGVEGGETAVRM